MIDKINEWIIEHGSATVMGQRLELAKERIAALERDNASLQREVNAANLRIRELEKKTLAPQFVEHRGVLFKRKPEGGYHLAVYCPECKLAMDSFPASIPYSCRCGRAANFNRNALDRVMREPPKD